MRRGNNNGGGGGGGACGACKFMRRKCEKGCIFEPYFESDQAGTAHFAAVHKVFGASNASKLLLKTPSHKRPEAVVSLCYEALARVRDPVYGCVSQLFSLQQQVINLQAELALVQAQRSTLQFLSLPPPQPQSPSTTNAQSSSDLASTSNASTTHFDPSTSMELVSFCNPMDQEIDNGDDDDDLQALAQEFVSTYLPGVKSRPPSPH
ncbi:hypothetical protein HYC85_010958 [Camellia sinensis]|uniref:LOB domain-containing protein n=1 Tax=Camellia sinensis TaxID=4442 RepID=A0A7J7HM04_CAMSI|nr:hypothetical protein HYC85_010958 [Camellia sinensis]